MSDTPTPVDPETAELLRYRAGHYLSAVARYLLKEGLPVTGVYVEAPFIEEDSKGHPNPVDAEGHLSFGAEVGAQLSPVGEATLGWDARAGWHFVRETGLKEPEEYRWLGQGLVPAPERIAVFMASAQMEFSDAGSEEQPNYRRHGDPYTDVLARLAAYEPHDPGRPEGTKYDWRAMFADYRRSVYERRVLDALLTKGADPVLSIPLRRSEVRALALYLEWFEPVFSYGHGDVAKRLQMDLTRRVPGDPASADNEREAVRAAQRRLDQLNKEKK